MLKNFTELMKSKSDEGLLQIIDFKDTYQPEAIQAAKTEIINRGGINKLRDENNKLQKKARNKQIKYEKNLEKENTPPLLMICDLCDHVQPKNNKRCTRCESVLSKNNTTRICPKCFEENDCKKDRCRNCLWDLNLEYNPEIETSIIKRYIKHHPFWGTMLLALGYLCIWVFILGPLFEKYFPSLNIGGLYLLTWMPILMVFTGYAARLRGRTAAWGMLAGIGIIILAVLPIVRNKTNNDFLYTQKF